MSSGKSFDKINASAISDYNECKTISDKLQFIQDNYQSSSDFLMTIFTSISLSENISLFKELLNQNLSKTKKLSKEIQDFSLFIYNKYFLNPGSFTLSNLIFNLIAQEKELIHLRRNVDDKSLSKITSDKPQLGIPGIDELRKEFTKIRKLVYNLQESYSSLIEYSKFSKIDIIKQTTSRKENEKEIEREIEKEKVKEVKELKEVKEIREIKGLKQLNSISSELDANSSEIVFKLLKFYENNDKDSIRDESLKLIGKYTLGDFVCIFIKELCSICNIITLPSIIETKANTLFSSMQESFDKIYKIMDKNINYIQTWVADKQNLMSELSNSNSKSNLANNHRNKNKNKNKKRRSKSIIDLQNSNSNNHIIHELQENDISNYHTQSNLKRTNFWEVSQFPLKEKKSTNKIFQTKQIGMTKRTEKKPLSRMPNSQIKENENTLKSSTIKSNGLNRLS